MNLPKLATENKEVTIVAFLLILIVGLQAYFVVPQYEDPIVQPPGGIIVAIYPGATPSDMESLIVDPLEESLYELEDVIKMDAEIQSGLATINLEFDFSTDTDEKFDDILSQVNDVKESLPDGLYDLRVMKKSTSDVNIYQIMLVGENTPYRMLQQEAEKLKDAIESINGLKAVDIEAYPERQVRISLDPIQMKASNISINDLEQAIQSSNANIPAGSLDLGGKQFNVQTSGFYEDLKEIKRTVVGTYRGQNVYLEDIASVDYQYEDERYIARINGKKSIIISIQQNENENVHTVSEAIRSRIDKLIFPTGIELVYAFEQTEQVKDSVNNFISNLLQGILLVGLIIWLVLGQRPAFLVMVSIPLSIFMAIVVIYQMELGLQQISIAGLIIALGLLVDNSIVIVENISRYLNEGLSRKEAAIRGCSELGGALISATLTTCLAFIPIITMPDKTGEFIRSMPITVVATLVASLIIAFTLTPFVASRIFKEGTAIKTTWIAKKFKTFANGSYTQLLTWVFKRRPLVIIGTIITFICAITVFVLYIDQSFFPKAQKPQFRITVRLTPGSNLDATDKVVKRVETVLDTTSLVDYYVANVGHGNPRIYYNVNSENFQSNFSEIYVRLKRYEEKEFESFIQHMRNTFDTFGEAQIDVKEYSQGPSTGAPIEVKVYEDNIERLKTLSLQVEERLAKHPAILNLSNEMGQTTTDLKLEIYREKAAMLGVPLINIDIAMRTFIAGRPVSKYRDDEGNEMNIVLRYDIRQADFSYEDFEKIQVESLSGSFIPLFNLANLTFIEAETSREHAMGNRTATVSADLKDGYAIKEVIKELSADLDELAWEESSYEFAGALEDQQSSFGGLLSATGFALGLCFMVLIIQFRSFTQPLIIFTALPFGVIGAVFLMFIFNETFSFMAFVGLISLIGIAINNSIVMVEFANQQLREGTTIREAAIEAGKIRLVPIVSTTLTTVLGIIPLTVFGGALWRPIGLVIIGGMISSTILILLLLPMIYDFFTSSKRTNSELDRSENQQADNNLSLE
ncbi:efflux RND transporter permease subunit [Winogradskyella endarachnes]|uniref:MMPL family transporter n=1 Tax=Winogradskyella endarachnes TaxID=2681965 RepID=A0A6L6UCZ9_9FLAO|nr:efflux RND transporter permease subunit [Winogradskyella endarachnes]MUU78644.1 MMPL family transporter [Winogradskyella endarachnes]